MIEANRKEFIKALKMIEKTRHVDVITKVNALVVSNKCCTEAFKNIEDIPVKNYKCVHGQWLLKWTK